MSIKENVSYIKDEISSEEKFFESFFKVEKFYKKYKIAIIGIVSLGFIYFIFTSINDYNTNQNIIKSNNLYTKVLSNPNDTVSLNALKKVNSKLYDIALYQISKDKTKSTNVEYLKEITQYNKAIQENDIKALDKLILNPDFLLKDFALFNKALIQSNNKEYKKAKMTLAIIPDNSAVLPLSNMLKHYLLTK
jgi:hypothetical protein